MIDIGDNNNGDVVLAAKTDAQVALSAGAKVLSSPRGSSNFSPSAYDVTGMADSLLRWLRENSK